MINDSLDISDIAPLTADPDDPEPDVGDMPEAGKPGRKRKQIKGWAAPVKAEAPFVPEWAGAVPGEHPALPLRPPPGVIR